KGDRSSPGRQRTRRLNKEGIIEPELRASCEYFIRVIKAGFGTDKHICAAIFHERNSTCIPVRLVAFYLDQSFDETIGVEAMDSPALLSQLNALNKSYIQQGHKEGIFFQRNVRIYTSVQIHGKNVPAIYFIKPDKIRNWTRSIALRDADEVAADIMLWNKVSNGEIQEEPNNEYPG
ncbi:MAG: SAM-dependent DNA methyltransferase, partial [bacterium]|nr:SAM-dependent DNA methyltransferase [bacterium]